VNTRAEFVTEYLLLFSVFLSAFGNEVLFSFFYSYIQIRAGIFFQPEQDLFNPNYEKFGKRILKRGCDPLRARKKASWEQVLTQFRQVHPVAFLIAFGSMYVAYYTFQLNIPFEEKIIPFLLSLLISLVTIYYEVYRINKQDEEKERIWRRRVLS
jgi:hypothetical protein